MLGKVIDRDFVANGNILKSLEQVGGVQFTAACGVILLSTLIPRGALAFNPKQLSGQVLEGQPGAEEEEDEFKKSDSLTDSREKQVV